MIVGTVMMATEGGLTMKVLLVMREGSTTDGYAGSDMNSHDVDHLYIMRLDDLSAC